MGIFGKKSARCTGQLLLQLLGDLAEDFGGEGVGLAHDHWHAVVAALADLGEKRHLAEERDALPRRLILSAAVAEYLDALEKLPRTVDVGTHVPHGSVRAYVLGDRERPGAVPTAEDIADWLNDRINGS